jgi:hypothetical protein
MEKFGYIVVEWVHDYGDEYPIKMYSELNSERYETRKIEFFSNGKVGYAYDDIEKGGTGLGLMPVPELEEIKNDSYEKFIPKEITKKEFEEIWYKYVRR